MRNIVLLAMAFGIALFLTVMWILHIPAEDLPEPSRVQLLELVVSFFGFAAALAGGGIAVQQFIRGRRRPQLELSWWWTPSARDRIDVNPAKFPESGRDYYILMTNNGNGVGKNITVEVWMPPEFLEVFSMSVRPTGLGKEWATEAISGGEVCRFLGGSDFVAYPQAEVQIGTCRLQLRSREFEEPRLFWLRYIIHEQSTTTRLRLYVWIERLEDGEEPNWEALYDQFTRSRLE